MVSHCLRRHGQKGFSSTLYNPIMYRSKVLTTRYAATGSRSRMGLRHGFTSRFSFVTSRSLSCLIIVSPGGESSLFSTVFDALIYSG